MATLKAMFQLMTGGFSSSIEKVTRGANAATDKILRASGAADTLNAKLDSTGIHASSASSGLSRANSGAGTAANGFHQSGASAAFANAEINHMTAGLSKNAAALKLAHQLQKEGLSKSEALTRAYDVIGRTAKKAGDGIGHFNDNLGKTSGKAGKSIDQINNSLGTTVTKAGAATRGLSRFLSVAAMVATAVKGMNIADEYTNTSTRLGLLTSSLKEQRELQNQIFAAADRSKGAYGSMADAVAKLGLLAGDSFSNNQEIVQFTELLQKSFKISGASTMEQQSALLQLSQAMASGKLQGDEFRSIMENAPMLADAIAKFTGKTKGQLKEMSAKGTITADIIKNAMFAAGDDINKKFETMPMTFSDIWNKIKNAALRTFGPVITRINRIINSDKFQDFTKNIEIGLYVMANAADKAITGIEQLYDFINKNWSKLVPVIEAVTTAWLTYKGVLLAVRTAQWLLNLASLVNPMNIIIVLIVVLVAGIALLWEKSEGFRDFFVEMWKIGAKSLAIFYNTWAKCYNSSVSALKAFVIINGETIKAIISQFSPLIDTISKIIDAYNALAKATGMQTIGFNINSKDLKALVDTAEDLALNKIDKTFKKKKTIDTDKLYSTLDTFGEEFKNFTASGWISDTLKKASDSFNKWNSSNKSNNSATNPTVVKGTGKNGKVDVDMSDEDIQYLRDLAEREYINKFSTATLAPKVKITFGNVYKEADADKVAGRIRKILRDEIAVAAEGAY